MTLCDLGALSPFLPSNKMGTHVHVANVVVAASSEHNDDESMPKKPAASRLTAEGTSASWKQQKKGVQDLYEKFAESSDEVKEKFPVKFSDLTAEQATSKDLYELWCGWLCDDYIIPAGKKNANQHLGYGSAIDYLNLLLNLACGKFKEHDDKTRLFFTCRDLYAHTDPAIWMRGLRLKLHREIYSRSVKQGKPMDMSALPVYLKTIIACVKQLSLEGSDEAALIKFVLLTVIHTGARSAEAANIILDSMRFDPEFTSVVGELPQMKTSKPKIFAIQAGIDSYHCWLLAFADFLCCVKRKEFEAQGGFEDDDDDDVDDKVKLPNWLIPDLQSSKTPGTKIGNWLKSLRPVDKGGSKKYANFSVPELPDSASAAGMRHGSLSIYLYLSFSNAHVLIRSLGFSLAHGRALTH